MLLAGDDNAPATPDHHAPALPSYRASTPPLSEHLLPGDRPQQRAHWLGQLPTFCRPKSADDDASSAVDRGSLRRACKEWLENPMNIALLLWLLCVGVSGGMLALLLLGLLDAAFPAPADRSRWHPALCHHLFLLCRWRPRDAADLRATYYKEGAAAAAAPRPGERAHLAVVVALLHLTVACQYVLFGLYWGYTRRTRPELAEDGFFVLGVVAPVTAAVYTVCSPLGKASSPCKLACSDVMVSDAKQRLSPVGHVVVEPERAGGMFECAGNASPAWWLSFTCTFCVFGWNMEWLGLGNACVHAATFALLCFAPLWVLGVSALHIRDVVGGAGVLLCACGLLYGGYWRIQMREKFGLPGSTACCGSNRYHVDDEVFFSKAADDDRHRQQRQSLLAVTMTDHHRDVFSATDMVAVSQGSPPDDDHVAVVVHDDDTMMAPPVQVVVEVEEDDKSVLFFMEDADDSMSSEGSWRVEKVKKLINMLTLVLLYTRGFLH
ncbi:hypothetical protein PVAP13_9NG835700 [Panicum virgatum]|uniref:Uncharacterized protein n=1 Tax=Panicum virgatum TaxID=38727 RepID=A0A8T0NAS4_PANVG|nr:hypothetical protein PVAP13_9NG835700 [Panicum virgatum]